MKKHIILGLLIAGLLTLTACVENSPYTKSPDSIPKESMAEPEFPLDKGTIMKTVDSLNLYHLRRRKRGAPDPGKYSIL